MTSCDTVRRSSIFLLLLATLFTATAQNVRFPFKNSEPDSFSIEISPFPPYINTRFSEFSPVMLPDGTLWFSSMRNDAAADRENFFETNWYCHIYSSSPDGSGNYSKPIRLPNKINNPKYFNSNFCINDKGDELLFSRCLRHGHGDLKCSLWKSTKRKNSWSKPEKLPEPLNCDECSTFQPNFVNHQDFKVLYFVSDRPGGYGNYDIWYSILDGGDFQQPINSGPVINTEGNEVTPFYDTATKTLFFSTDERKGFGDYDIWFSKGALSGWTTPEILGKPFNSEYNDFYFSVNPDRESACLSSNRLHYGMIDDTCCNDIYLVSWEAVAKDTAVPAHDSTVKEKIASVLPITLYFQNDSPDPRSLSDTTVHDYLELCNEYISDIQQYIKGAGEGLIGDEQRAAMYSVAAFMRDSVQTGHVRLLLLMQYLEEALVSGDTVSLTIQGFASPLHNSQYNTNLSKRRIVSFLNTLRNHDGGKLLPYIEGRITGLTVKVRPEGAVRHSFETGEARETVFGLRAAKDRKIVISG